MCDLCWDYTAASSGAKEQLIDIKLLVMIHAAALSECADDLRGISRPAGTDR